MPSYLMELGVQTSSIVGAVHITIVTHNVKKQKKKNINELWKLS